jgi:hypothetical protein
LAKALLGCAAPFHALILEGVAAPGPDAPDALLRLERDTRVRRVTTWSPHEATGDWICLLRADADMDDAGWLPALYDFAITSGAALAQYKPGFPACLLVRRDEIAAFWDGFAAAEGLGSDLVRIQRFLKLTHARSL